MKIAHAHLSREFAGSERYCASLASGQAEAGHDVMVIVRQSAVTARWKRECAPASVVVLPKWVPGFLESWTIRQVLTGFAPEIVHTHLGRANIKVGRVARRLKLPWVVTLHLRWKPQEMQHADALICIAKWQQQDIPTDTPGMEAVIWNWLPTRRNEERGSEVARNGDAAALRAGMGFDDRTFVFGSVGRLHGQKGMDLLVRAFKIAFTAEDNARLVLIGEGSQRAEILRLVDGDPRITLTGYVPDVGPYYPVFDAYVSASRYEPFGLTILEAMAAGCRLVCTHTEGPGEFLKGQPVCWAQKSDVPSLVSALRTAFEAGRKRTPYEMAPFSMARALLQIEDVYRAVRNKEQGTR